MHNERSTSPRLCVLTQTASDIRPYYREFFAGLDLFFVTFKQKHPDAVDFLPGSTWSDGRNRLWEHVKGRYDYYLFIDDDLEFFGLPDSLMTDRERSAQRAARWRPRPLAGRLLRRLGLRKPLPPPDLTLLRYRRAEPERFLAALGADLRAHRPAVASVALTWDGVAYHAQDYDAMTLGRAARPLGWFDAQVTIFSEVGARLLLPYDTRISGWWSAQMPIYVLAHLAFGDRAVNFLDLASRNPEHNLYRPGYDGTQDCITMSEWLSQGFRDAGLGPLIRQEDGHVDLHWGDEAARRSLPPPRRAPAGGETLEDALRTLSASFDLHHPYVYDRHRALVDAVDARPVTRVTEKAT